MKDKKIKKTVTVSFYLMLILALLISSAFANNLVIDNVVLGKRIPALGTIVVEFDLAWNNSWKTKINHDAVWLTFRLNDSSVPINKKICHLTNSGFNPIGTDIGTNEGGDIYIPEDKLGIFIRPDIFDVGKKIDLKKVRVSLDYASCDFDMFDEVVVSIFGLEMVYVPKGEFYVGDNGVATGSLQEGSSDSDPWYISDNAAINVTSVNENGFRYVSGGNTQENASGSSFIIPANFPNGYDGFYVMKYEITEGQWVEFFNSLPSNEARQNRDLTNTSHKNSDAVKYRNTVVCSGSPIVCSSYRLHRSVNYLTWMDFVAFLDWAALRPMSELEFEKASRGPVLPVSGEFVWGNTNIESALAISLGDENGEEIITTMTANAHYGDITLTGGDTDSGIEHKKGPLRSGIFAQHSSSRERAGSSYYGIMALSGNLDEYVVTIGNLTGRSFMATHGDGVLTEVSSYEGNATNFDWAGIDPIVNRGVTSAFGSGFRGGAWDDTEVRRLSVSDRYSAANGSSSASYGSGGRGVRSYNKE